MERNYLQKLYELEDKVNESPLATHVSGQYTYIVYGAETVGSVTGYKIKRIDSITDSTSIESTFLPESLRVSGANGSGANVDLRDLATAVLLLQDASVIFG